jgi:hypothetical protein
MIVVVTLTRKKVGLSAVGFLHPLHHHKSTSGAAARGDAAGKKRRARGDWCSRFDRRISRSIAISNDKQRAALRGVFSEGRNVFSGS